MRLGVLGSSIGQLVVPVPHEASWSAHTSGNTSDNILCDPSSGLWSHFSAPVPGILKRVGPPDVPKGCPELVTEKRAFAESVLLRDFRSSAQIYFRVVSRLGLPQSNTPQTRSPPTSDWPSLKIAAVEPLFSCLDSLLVARRCRPGAFGVACIGSACCFFHWRATATDGPSAQMRRALDPWRIEGKIWSTLPAIGRTPCEFGRFLPDPASSSPPRRCDPPPSLVEATSALIEPTPISAEPAPIL